MVRLEEGRNSNGHKVSKTLWMYFILIFEQKNQFFPINSFTDTSTDMKYLTNWRNAKIIKFDLI